jgi:hypothetical protein
MKLRDGANVRSGEEAELKEAERLGKERAKGEDGSLAAMRPLNR